MSIFKRTQRKYVKISVRKAYRVRNWREGLSREELA